LVSYVDAMLSFIGTVSILSSSRRSFFAWLCVDCGYTECARAMRDEGGLLKREKERERGLIAASWRTCRRR